MTAHRPPAPARQPRSRPHQCRRRRGGALRRGPERRVESATHPARVGRPGGSAIEIHAPGIYRSDDIDVVIEAPNNHNIRARIDAVFTAIGFESRGRHWHLGDLFVEVPSSDLTDPVDVVRAGANVFRVVRKEVLLADRIVGFKHWRYTGYAQQAIDMIAAFGDSLDLAWLRSRLEQEAAWDAYQALVQIAASGSPVTTTTLNALLATLHHPSAPEG